MKSVQLIGITLEELKQIILLGVKSQIDELKNNMQPKTPTEYLTRNEVAEYFKVDISTVHNWTKKGKLKAYGMSGRVYYKRQEIEAALSEIS
ncbi:MAG: helix-turn-helix domain-containing protein [Galbibacter orientalis]|uniref:helix-turn-helix domain-containing protein n=1 Tax=Galbibacter orientalis TaxID=453852 RepID=UPI003002F044